jgi:hypothetical protein
MELHERGKNSTHEVERRHSLFTDDDIDRIAEALQRKASSHWGVCRFNDIDPKVMAEAAQFYQNFNSVFGESGKIIWRTVLTLGVGGFVVIIGMGIIAKFKEISGQ